MSKIIILNGIKKINKQLNIISISIIYICAIFFKSTRGNLLVKDIFNVVSHVHTKYDRVYNRKMST